jgi:thiamine pyrophosphate-dependent acetolactate synthase large subunit-like protein
MLPSSRASILERASMRSIDDHLTRLIHSRIAPAISSQPEQWNQLSVAERRELIARANVLVATTLDGLIRISETHDESLGDVDQAATYWLVEIRDRFVRDAIASDGIPDAGSNTISYNPPHDGHHSGGA